MATAWATVDLTAIAHNVRSLAMAAAPADLCAVVKAGGYGHGAVEVARAAVDAGAGWLAVAHVGEGEALREAGIGAPILVLAEPEQTDFVRVAEADLRVTLFTADGIAAAAHAAATTGYNIAVHLKVDTGMHRVGAAPDDVLVLARNVVADPGLRLEGVWTHLAVADEPANSFTRRQLDLYHQVLAELAAEGIEVPLRHSANSAGAIAHPDARLDLVRCGIAVYGISPSGELEGAADLRPALTLAARITHVKAVAAGEAISYGLRHTFDADATVATVAIGYADGVRRDSYARGVEVLIGGQRCRVVGTVTMDQIMVDCTPAVAAGATVAVGDEAVLIGTQGDHTITATEIAEHLDTIPYEVICGIGPRVERRWTD